MRLQWRMGSRCNLCCAPPDKKPPFSCQCLIFTWFPMLYNWVCVYSYYASDASICVKARKTPSALEKSRDPLLLRLKNNNNINGLQNVAGVGNEAQKAVGKSDTNFSSKTHNCHINYSCRPLLAYMASRSRLRYFLNPILYIHRSLLYAQRGIISKPSFIHTMQIFIGDAAEVGTDTCSLTSISQINFIKVYRLNLMAHKQSD